VTLSDVFGDVWGEIEWVGVIVGAVAFFALGALWYAPPVFGKLWRELTGVSPGTGNPPVAALVVGFVGNFATALALGFLAVLAGVGDALDGVLLGLVAGIGFRLVVAVENVLFEQKPSQLVWINAGYNLIGTVLAALVIGIFS
jgi:hypothetical protein